ncbi:MAG: hypothetical protein JWQ76_1872 [Ramlibacter sp.]|nr:hypothetical protein [Ramlibacter sp.]
MTTKLALSSLVLAAAFAGNAFAESPNAGVVNDNFTSSKTRAEVQADLAAYKQAGVNPWSTQYNPLRGFQSTRTRADVVADYLASRDEVHALTSEDSGSGYLAQMRVTGVPPTALAGQPHNPQ